MTESTELKPLKAGETKQYTIGDKTLILEPIPYGRLKKVLKIIVDAVGDISKGKDMTHEELAKTMPEVLINNVNLLLPLLFDPKKHPFMNQDWLENNMSLPIVMDIGEAAIKINGMMDFFAKVKAFAATTPSPTQTSEIRPLVETPKT